jgi:hypothetical protein
MSLCGFEVGLDRPLFLIGGRAGRRSLGTCDPGGAQGAGGESP